MIPTVEFANKPFKGVISHWKEDGNVIVGYAQYHDNRDWQYGDIHTSRVLNLQVLNSDMILCETKNSFYLLIGKHDR